MDQIPVPIGGRPVTVGSVDPVPVTNPYDGSVLAVVPRCGPEEVHRACRAAAAALDRDDFPQHERAAVLERAAAMLRDRAEAFAEQITLESGKPIRTARVEAARCTDTLTFAAVEARRLSGEVVPMEASASGTGKLGFTLRVPIGVVGAITPFNFPLNLVAHKIAPAVAAGCPVVLKPAPQTPLSGLELVALLVEAGLPDDWISVVTDGGKEAGEPLVAHEVPAMITFTGSAPVGWSIAASAPRKKVSLELGSNSPVIVEPDADLELIASKVRVAGFAHAGQSCISVQRVIVHRDVHEAMVALLQEAAESLVVGDPRDEATDVGPLIRPAEVDRVRSWIDDAVGRGARLVTGGTATAEGTLRPTVVDRAPADTDLCAQEIFGPVVVTIPYGDFDEALAIANATEYGLHAGVFTNDLPKALQAARVLRFGGVLVNEVPTFRADQQPYGGVRQSGNTREGPAYTVREMTELRFVSLE
jgi:acyl-CoA reductase-like NAD-dependent aldehyde dehydrogenase